MIFLSNPPVYFLPGTWESPDVVYNTAGSMIQLSVIVIMFAVYATLSIRLRKRKRKLN
tara:strand:+ start:1482 stop:1655 length:174 start_codon:yes stop_codon:yes gene_type:complete